MSSPRRPPGTTATRAVAPSGGLAVGDLLAGRYLLLEAVAGTGATVLWRASDEALARPVAVKVASAGGATGPATTQRFLDAAIRSGAAVHPGLVRVYDAAIEHRPRGTVGYVISEWVEGERLDVLLRDGPLAAPEAADVLRQAADALTTAHARGLVHGRLHPGNVLVTATGRVRITDTEVAAVLHGSPCRWQPGR